MLVSVGVRDFGSSAVLWAKECRYGGGGWVWGGYIVIDPVGDVGEVAVKGFMLHHR